MQQFTQKLHPTPLVPLQPILYSSSALRAPFSSLICDTTVSRKQAVVRPNPDAYAAVGVAVAALVVAASFDAVHGPSESLADSVHILFDETEDVDEAEPRART